MPYGNLDKRQRRRPSSIFVLARGYATILLTVRSRSSRNCVPRLRDWEAYQATASSISDCAGIKKRTFIQSYIFSLPVRKKQYLPILSTRSLVFSSTRIVIVVLIIPNLLSCNTLYSLNTGKSKVIGIVIRRGIIPAHDRQKGGVSTILTQRVKYNDAVEYDHLVRRRIRMCYWKQWRRARRRIGELIKLGAPKYHAILIMVGGNVGSQSAFSHFNRITSSSGSSNPSAGTGY
jgi:hypothetical protein